MLTAKGCHDRRRRLWDRLKPPPDNGYLILSDPIHLRYFANFWVDPFSYAADFGGLLLLKPDGSGVLYHDNRLSNSVARAHVEQRRVVIWYDGQSPATGPRRMVVGNELYRDLFPGSVLQSIRVHDQPNDKYAAMLYDVVATMRRQKDPDEIALLRDCSKAAEAGHAWARDRVAPGMTELDVYLGVSGACVQAVGEAVIVYGDFAVSPGPDRTGGPATRRILKSGDLIIVDFSVVIGGYRCDFTNTLAVGKKPSSAQEKLCQLAREAMAAGESLLKAGAQCQEIHNAVNGIFQNAGMAAYFGHHSGHGLGLTHPDSPFLVRNATESLVEGDVITLEPGLYVPGVGGLRIEHNYLITKSGYERLSNHHIGLV